MLKHQGSAVAIAATVLAISVAGCGSTGTTKTARTTPAKSKASGSKAVKKSRTDIPGDGNFEVPGDVKPGRYRTAGPAANAANLCYFARLRNMNGDVDSIITNGTVTGPTTITIKASDKGFESTGCKAWKKLA